MSADVVPGKARLVMTTMTRRTAIGAGLAFASLVGTGTHVSAAPRRSEARSIDALLVDETAPALRAMAVALEAGSGTLPVVGIRLDAAGQAGLKRLLEDSSAIVGISSGATLFCLERIAWDHGFRVTGRSQHCASDLAEDSCRRDVAGFLSGIDSPSSGPSSLARAYRPSRADGMVHAWLMRKPSGRQLRHGREVRS